MEKPGSETMSAIDPRDSPERMPESAKKTRASYAVAGRLALIALPLLPVLYLLSLVAKYGVDVPYADEFTLLPLVPRAQQHAVTFADLFFQHNEHRPFFPRLLIIALARLAQGNLRAEMFFSVFLTFLVSGILWIIIGKTVTRSLAKRLLLIFLLNLVLFSPVQAENWMWGFQFTVFLCNFLFSCGLLAAVSTLGLRKKFALCAAIAVVATFSFGSGMLLWALTFPLALIMEKGMRRPARWLWLTAWFVLAAGAVALYFFRYFRPPYHPVMAASGSPIDYFLYVATFLGAHLSRASRLEPILQAAMIGSTLLALYFGAGAYAFRYRRDLALVSRMVPWFAFGAYSLASALLAAAARIGFGVNQALDSRYTSFSLYISMGVIPLIVIVVQDICSRRKSEGSERALLRLETVLLTSFFFFAFAPFSWGRDFMIETHLARLRGKGALLFSNVIDTGEVIERYLNVKAPEARRVANLLDRAGMMHPPMLNSAEIRKLTVGVKPGGFLAEMKASGESYKVEGGAVLPKLDRPADCVILSYSQGDTAIAFRIANEIRERPDVAAMFQRKNLLESGWIARFDRSQVPPGDHWIAGWAFDAKKATLYPLTSPQLLH